MTLSFKYIKSVFNLEDLPTVEKPIIFLMGRSNVGKSSFINYLANQKNLAYTSSLPGKTISLNYYLVDNKFYLVDSPGYGYAKIAKSTIEKWNNFLISYFKTANIKLVLHLMDSKVGPTNKDIDAYNFTKNYVRDIIILLTKADKLNQSEQANVTKNVEKQFDGYVYNQNIFLISVKSNKNKDKIIKTILNLSNE